MPFYIIPVGGVKMNLQEKLQYLRKSKGLSQEELADKLEISRQAVSKWESGQSTPDINKIILLSEIYKVTIDSLLKDSCELNIAEVNFNKEKEPLESNNKQIIINLNRNSFEYEYKSKKRLFGVPLIHINLGRGLKKAKGIVAIGNIAYGIISIGMISLGILSFGVVSIALISLAVLSIGLLLAMGAISLGVVSIGAISIGIYSLGALAIGKYAIGAAAVASDIAIGDYAKGNIAIGNNVSGINTLSMNSSISEIRSLIKQEYPNLSNKFIMFISNLVKMIK